MNNFGPIFPPELKVKELIEPICKTKDVYHSIGYNSKNHQQI